MLPPRQDLRINTVAPESHLRVKTVAPDLDHVVAIAHQPVFLFVFVTCASVFMYMCVHTQFLSQGQLLEREG